METYLVAIRQNEGYEIMKVLFAYINTTKSLDLPLGIGYLAGMLKARGYSSSLLDLTWHKGEITEDLVKPYTNHDLLCLSATTLEYSDALKVARHWKSLTEKPVILGGCKPTIEPLETINNPLVDAICLGEGEYPLAAFVRQYEEKKDITQIIAMNFWIKDGKEVRRFPMSRLVEDLDTLPFPDRSIFDKRHIELMYPATTFLTSRGCPFHCSMCINHYLQKLYEGLGNYTRFRTIDNLFQEITQVRQAYNVKRLFFIDDTFTINQTRLKEFIKRYKSEVDLPFLCMGRCNTVTQDLLKGLADAGCIYMGFGIESGNPEIRNGILKRDMTDEEITNAFKWAREAGIFTASYNMIGIPTETRQQMFDTINLNKIAKPDAIQTTLLFPFPKTEIYETAKSLGYLAEESSDQKEYYTKSIIKCEMNSKQLAALVLAIPYYVHLPKFLWWAVRVLEWLFTKTRRLDLPARVFRKKVLERKFFKEMVKK